MSIKDEFERAWRHAAKAGGGLVAEVIFRGAEDVAKNIPVILLLGITERQIDQTGAWEPMDIIEYWLEDLERVVNLGDAFVVDGKAYTVRQVLSNNGLWVQAEVGRDD